MTGSECERLTRSGTARKRVRSVSANLSLSGKKERERTRVGLPVLFLDFGKTGDEKLELVLREDLKMSFGTIAYSPHRRACRRTRISQ